jgi:hypothetical protein
MSTACRHYREYRGKVVSPMTLNFKRAPSNDLLLMIRALRERAARGGKARGGRSAKYGIPMSCGQVGAPALRLATDRLP